MKYLVYVHKGQQTYCKFQASEQKRKYLKYTNPAMQRHTCSMHCMAVKLFPQIWTRRTTNLYKSKKAPPYGRGLIYALPWSGLKEVRSAKNKEIPWQADLTYSHTLTQCVKFVGGW